MVTNFCGSIAVFPIMDAKKRLEALLSAGEIGIESISLSLSIASYGFVKMALAILGAAILFYNRRKYSLSEYLIGSVSRTSEVSCVAISTLIYAGIPLD